MICPSVKPAGPGYHFVKEKKTWGDAEKHCQGIRGHLVTIGSLSMNNQMLQQMKNK